MAPELESEENRLKTSLPALLIRMSMEMSREDKYLTKAKTLERRARSSSTTSIRACGCLDLISSAAKSPLAISLQAKKESKRNRVLEENSTDEDFGSSLCTDKSSFKSQSSIRSCYQNILTQSLNRLEMRTRTFQDDGNDHVDQVKSQRKNRDGNPNRRPKTSYKYKA